MPATDWEWLARYGSEYQRLRRRVENALVRRHRDEYLAILHQRQADLGPAPAYKREKLLKTPDGRRLQRPLSPEWARWYEKARRPAIADLRARHRDDVDQLWATVADRMPIRPDPEAIRLLRDLTPGDANVAPARPR